MRQFERSQHSATAAATTAAGASKLRCNDTATTATATATATGASASSIAKRAASCRPVKSLSTPPAQDEHVIDRTMQLLEQTMAVPPSNPMCNPQSRRTNAPIITGTKPTRVFSATRNRPVKRRADHMGHDNKKWPKVLRSLLFRTELLVKKNAKTGARSSPPTASPRPQKWGRSSLIFCFSISFS
ncbi:hypothetical protein BC939DRAFT_490009 [Gamsiella multidivaricata]|uniref:uncharacterized protein n=1 Tax=Gamsiella multidivaricata TaxID=101098 RepID=UPI00221FEE58|nr:uncharacterized protein BC939DRAFT_490009 [Gamsiella multidivaricata]KAI7830302.1 hypothetical protein BC939DRAFT_490009 [Gamsiella multidivaricata]